MSIEVCNECGCTVDTDFEEGHYLQTDEITVFVCSDCELGMEWDGEDYD